MLLFQNAQTFNLEGSLVRQMCCIEFVLFNWYILVPVDGLQLKVKPD